MAPSCSFDSRWTMKPDRHVEHVEIGGTDHAASGDDSFGCSYRILRERHDFVATPLDLRRINLHRRAQHLLQGLIGDGVRLTALECISGGGTECCGRCATLRARGRRPGPALGGLLAQRLRHCVQAVTGSRGAAALLDFALNILCFGTSRLNNRAAFKPKILRFASSSRNGSVVIALGRSKSQCGQSDANSSCVLALIASNVASVSFKFERSSGWLVKYISWMYSLGRRLSSGASDDRIIYSESSRCIRNGTQASPLSIHTTFSFGNRSGSPLMIQFVR